MKKILLISFLFIGFLAKAQQYTQFQGYGFKANRIWADSVSIQPNDTIRNKVARSLAVIGTTLYVADGIKWNAITGGGGGSVDTFLISTRLWRQKGIDSLNAIKLNKSDTSTLSNRINLKLNIVDTTNKFLSAVSQPNDSTLVFQKGTTSTPYIIRASTSGSAIRLVTTVYNNTGVTIPKGSVVYINGRHSSNLPTVALAQGNNEENSYKTFALVQDDILTTSSGIAIQAGKIENLNLPTSTYTDGDIVYLSPTVPGGLTIIKPLAPNHVCKIGSITRAHPTLGSIEIKIENGWQLDEMSDVSIALIPLDSTILQFSRVDSLWHDVNPTTAMGNRFVKSVDSATMLSPYYRTATATAALATKLNISDTSVFSRKLIQTNRQTASYTLALTDLNQLVEINNASANTLTVPLFSSIAFAIGSKIDIVQYGAGQTTITPVSGVTINSFGGALKIAGHYGACTLVKIGTNEWYCFGNLSL